MVEEVTTYSDSYWAGCQGNSKVIKCRCDAARQSHVGRTHTPKQHIIASCSAETELYAAALGASGTQGMVWSFCDLGYEMKPVLSMEAKVTEHIFHRQGIGRLKHMDIAYLWMQDVRVRRVKK